MTAPVTALYVADDRTQFLRSFGRRQALRGACGPIRSVEPQPDPRVLQRSIGEQQATAREADSGPRRLAGAGLNPSRRGSPPGRRLSRMTMPWVRGEVAETGLPGDQNSPRCGLMYAESAIYAQWRRAGRSRRCPSSTTMIRSSGPCRTARGWKRGGSSPARPDASRGPRTHSSGSRIKNMMAMWTGDGQVHAQTAERRHRPEPRPQDPADGHQAVPRRAPRIPALASGGKKVLPDGLRSAGGARRGPHQRAQLVPRAPARREVPARSSTTSACPSVGQGDFRKSTCFRMATNRPSILTRGTGATVTSQACRQVHSAHHRQPRSPHPREDKVHLTPDKDPIPDASNQVTSNTSPNRAGQ